MFSQSCAYELKDKSVKRKTIGISLILHALLGLFLLFIPFPKDNLPQEIAPKRQLIKITPPFIEPAPPAPQIPPPPPADIAPAPQKLPPMPREAPPATKPITPNPIAPKQTPPLVAAPTAPEVAPLLTPEPLAPAISEEANFVPAEQKLAVPTPVTGAPDTARGGNNVSIDSIRSKFISALEKNKVYPYIARKQNQTGTVSVVVVLDELGNLENVRVVDSSGFSQLDNAAIALVRKICPFSHNADKVVTMNISINYDLK